MGTPPLPLPCPAACPAARCCSPEDVCSGAMVLLTSAPWEAEQQL